MAKYFNYFPKTFYSANTENSNLETVTNIISRINFLENVKKESTVFYEYELRDGDTPEIIAGKYYDSPERHWIVLMFNDIIDPQFDWPLSYNTFINFVDKKYTDKGAANTTPQTGLAWAMDNNNVHSYYYTKERTNSDGTTITEILQVDANTYANVTVSSNNYTLGDGTTITETTTKNTKTYFEYENELNESKRKIKLIKRDYIQQIEKEMKKNIK